MSDPAPTGTAVPDGPDRLARIGDAIGDPDPLAADLARGSLGDRVRPLGRLADLACWWASVRGPGRAGPPERVLLVGGRPRVAAGHDAVEVLPLTAGDADGAAGGVERSASEAEDVAATVPTIPPDPVDAALEHGLAVADEAAARGVDLIVLCVDDPEATRALNADLLGLDAVETCGWPTEQGIGDDEWMDRVAGLREALRRLKGLRDRPADLLNALDRPRAATAVAVLLQASVHRIPALLDGPGAAAAALLVRRTHYSATSWWQVAQDGGDAVHGRAAASLGLRPLTHLDITLEDGTAGLTALAVLREAAVLLSALPAPPADEIDPL